MKKLFLSLSLILGLFFIQIQIQAYQLTNADLTIVNSFEQGIIAKGSEFTQKIIILFESALDKNILNEQKTAIVEELLEKLNNFISQNQYIPEGLLEAVNLERSKLGLPNLKLNEKLNQAAYNHADYMSSKPIFDHTGENGSQPRDRVTAAGYEWSFVAENIAWGQTTVGQVMESRMNSPGHKANILSDQATEIGLARVGNYRVQVFATPK